MSGMPAYRELFPTAKELLLYVAAVIAARLGHRTVPTISPLSEPPLHNTRAWPPVVGY